MIDHITVSNELADLFIDGSARVHYEFYGADYTKTTFTFLYLQDCNKSTLDGNTATNITCNGVPMNCYGYSFRRSVRKRNKDTDNFCHGRRLSG
jgi:hypothetical protein